MLDRNIFWGQGAENSSSLKKSQLQNNENLFKSNCRNMPFRKERGLEGEVSGLISSDFFTKGDCQETSVGEVGASHCSPARRGI